ncbi:MAG: Trk system potassium transporter TrkA [Alphaproteobacteria bacterium]|nr:Trk system potassium transporter TrkA [Alphaproteobacteria bacterium]
MKVIVCGAGQVGYSIARYLATEQNDVTVIDQSAELIHKISDSIEARAIVGHASHPSVLEQAGAADADVIIAVTYTDEVNMVACTVAHALFNVPTKIARIRQQNYLQPIWADLFARDHVPIDVIISPEIEVARAVARRLQVPGAFDVVPLGDGAVRVVGVRCAADCPVVNTPLRQLTGLFPDLHIVVVAILRDERPIVPDSDDQMLPGDEVYFVCEASHVSRALSAFGHEEPEARRIVIAGGGNIGMFLAQEIEAHQPGVSLKLIELNAERANAVQQSLSRTVVLTGSALDPEILEEANVRQAETFVALTNEDEVNIIASLLAKRFGAGRTVTLVNSNSYGPLVGQLGIDAVVSPRAITVSSILQHIRRGRIRAAYSLRDGFGEVIEAEAMETSGLVGKQLKDARFPPGTIVGAIVRGKDVIMPRSNTVIQAKDRVVIFATAETVKKIEKLFSVQLEFF